MINRAKMPRQLRNKGGITSIVPREQYGLGSEIKDRVRKLIPNELADVAVTAAPFVAPFFPGTAALMRGIGRFDQRGSISDALKQGAGTYAFGRGTRYLAGAEGPAGGFDTYSVQGFKEGPIGSLFQSQQAAETAKTTDDARKGFEGVKKLSDATIGKVPILKDLPPSIQDRIVFGGITSAASYVYEKFVKEEPPQQEGETVEEYLARRKENVGVKMRTYFDNYFSFDKEYSQLDDAGRDAFVARYNLSDGGRIGYQTGGITMANTLAQNIARNKAAQAAFQKSIAPIQQATMVDTAIKQNVRKDPSFLSQVKEGYKKHNEENQLLRNALKDKKITEEQYKRMGGFNVAQNMPNISVGGVKIGSAEDVGLASLGYQGIKKLAGAIDPNDPNAQYGDIGAMRSIALNYEGAKGLAEDELNLYNRILGKTTAATTTPDASTVSQEGIIPGFKKVRDTKYYNADGTVKRKAVQDANFVAGMFPSEFYYVGPDGQAYGPETYGSIAAGMYPNIYDPRASAASGGMPTGIMRKNKAGVMERDYRDEGGFVPVGIKEKADDVPAMLSKNEFVFTADAVRGAGNGSIEKGAQKMYDTMKRLEKRVV